jgi:hypothetical protein
MGRYRSIYFLSGGTPDDQNTSRHLACIDAGCFRGCARRNPTAAFVCFLAEERLHDQSSEYSAFRGESSGAVLWDAARPANGGANVRPNNWSPCHFNYLWCSQAKGEKNPNEGRDLEKLPSKAELTKALGDAFAYCDGVYGSLTDASAQQVVEITQENGSKARLNRVSLLVLNYGHNNEHYGNLVTYMRIKSIVPASSEPRQP